MQNSKLDVRSILQVLNRRKWFIIIPFLLGGLGAYVRIATLVPIYQSSATVLLGKNFYLTPEVNEVVPGIAAQNRVRLRDSKENIYMQIINKIVLSKLIDKMDLQPSKTMMDQAKEIVATSDGLTLDEAVRSVQVEWLKNKIVVNFPKRGEYIEIGGKSTDSYQAYLIAKNLTDIFIEESINDENSGVKGTWQFANAQAEIYRVKLEEARDKLRQHKLNMAQLSSQVMPVNVENLSHVNALLSTNAIDLTEKQDQKKFLEQRLGGKINDIKILKTNKATALKANLIEKNSKVAELMISFQWNSGEVLRLNQEVGSLKQQMIDEIRANSSMTKSSLTTAEDLELAIQLEITKNEIDLLRQKQNTLTRLIDLFKNKQTVAPSYQIEEEKLNAEVMKNQQMYQTFLDQAQSSKIREAMLGAEAEIRFQIIDPAQIPVTPINADVSQIIVLALIAGLGLGGSLVYMLEFIDNSFKSIDEIENSLGLLVLGTIPKIEFGEQAKPTRRWAFPVVAFSIVILIVAAFVLFK